MHIRGFSTVLSHYTYIFPIYYKKSNFNFLSVIVSTLVCKDSQKPAGGLIRSETCLLTYTSKLVTDECINLQYTCCVETVNNIQIHPQHDVPIQSHSLPDSCIFSKLTNNLCPNELFPFIELVSQGQPSVFVGRKRGFIV